MRYYIVKLYALPNYFIAVKWQELVYIEHGNAGLKKSTIPIIRICKQNHRDFVYLYLVIKQYKFLLKLQQGKNGDISSKAVEWWESNSDGGGIEQVKP